MFSLFHMTLFVKDVLFTDLSLAQGAPDHIGHIVYSLFCSDISVSTY